jgi:hypothetical protein
MVTKDDKKEKRNTSEDAERYKDKKEFLLTALWYFHEQGKDEVSISELQESISQYQKITEQDKYSYSDKFMLSPDLLYDLKELSYKGYIRDYHYRLDGLLPKRFLALTSLGRGVGKNVSKTLTADLSMNLNSAVSTAIDNYNKRWRLWGR